ncbi:MAG: hypothetical protein ACXWZE_08375 [Candidatus Binatia bacterium]
MLLDEPFVFIVRPNPNPDKVISMFQSMSLVTSSARTELENSADQGTDRAKWQRKNFADNVHRAAQHATGFAPGFGCFRLGFRLPIASKAATCSSPFGGNPAVLKVANRIALYSLYSLGSKMLNVISKDFTPSPCSGVRME